MGSPPWRRRRRRRVATKLLPSPVFAWETSQVVRPMWEVQGGMHHSLFVKMEKSLTSGLPAA